MLHPGWTSTRVTAVALAAGPQHRRQEVPGRPIEPLHQNLSLLWAVVRHTHLHWLEGLTWEKMLRGLKKEEDDDEKGEEV